MHTSPASLFLARRQFLTSSASGLGGAALASLLCKDGLFAREPTGTNPLAAREPHFPAKAKACIFILPEGAPSHIDLFDPKPKLRELHGQPLPDSLLKNVRFAFIKKESAVLAGSAREFTRHGQCGMELSDYVPRLGQCADDICLVRSLHTDAFNHHPAQLMLNSGVPRFGRPSMGSWLVYGLGSESENLPGYVVLAAGRGGSAGVSNWTSGFLPSSYEGVVFRSQGEPVLGLANPPGVTRQMQQEGLETLTQLNRRRYEQMHDPEIASRIASYELAFRMQAAAPELIDLSQETQATLDAYGVTGPTSDFAYQCLLARRFAEAGVRFIEIATQGWDHHGNLQAGMTRNWLAIDQPIATLINDLRHRGLLNDTLIVWGGEFGRTPHAQRPDGRDHNSTGFSMFMVGGGVKGGISYGATDEHGIAAVENKVHVHDLHATILHLLGLDHTRLTYRYSGRDFRLTDVYGRVVKEIIV